MEATIQHFENAQKQADSYFDEAIKNQIKNQESIDETNKKLKQADKALIEDFMEGLIHYIYNQRARKRK